MSEATTEQTKKPIRYHGFTCPKCGGHMFRTTKNYKQFYKDLPEGVDVGVCTQKEYEPFYGVSSETPGCSYVWNRQDPEKEAEAIYFQTRDEWMAGFEPINNNGGECLHSNGYDD